MKMCRFVQWKKQLFFHFFDPHQAQSGPQISENINEIIDLRVKFMVIGL